LRVSGMIKSCPNKPFTITLLVPHPSLRYNS